MISTPFQRLLHADKKNTERESRHSSLFGMESVIFKDTGYQQKLSALVSRAEELLVLSLAFRYSNIIC